MKAFSLFKWTENPIRRERKRKGGGRRERERKRERNREREKEREREREKKKKKIEKMQSDDHNSFKTSMGKSSFAVVVPKFCLANLMRILPHAVLT